MQRERSRRARLIPAKVLGSSGKIPPEFRRGFDYPGLRTVKLGAVLGRRPSILRTDAADIVAQVRRQESFVSRGRDGRGRRVL